ncbi:MAG: type I restriction enzyme HsdR N-terminal domain-containing protein [Candidatus Shikimatogenerans sp. Tder]|uniref:Type I restriction enzyme HsdR N-terminal domain-containing protein n=1 Tax=Candidatus Shikimatogenerans sp. Tder TaxID=3158566 RepID=A0AAU7QRE9_9FLAO
MNYYNFLKIIKIKKKKYIFCIKRKKYIIFNNEEIIRQNILYYIIYIKKINRKKIIVEKKIKKQKIDILIIKNNKPYILIECKNNNININIKYFKQILKYNKYIKSKYIYIYNGIYLILITNKNKFFIKNDL